MTVSDAATRSPVPAKTAADTDTVMVRARQLGKRVSLPSGPLTILEGVDFSIRAGERVAIVGASGSGKSTLLSLLAGLDTPSSGDVELAGTWLAGLDEDGRARLRGEQVGFVFQAFQLLPSLTALENAMLPLELRGERDARGPAQAILEAVGLGERLNHYPRQLSGGEQQRVALARAFVTRPQVLFADEPTGNLDTHTGEAVVNLLFQMNAESGTTLVLVTHDPELAARCDRVLHIDAGRLARSSHADSSRDRPDAIVEGDSSRLPDAGVAGATSSSASDSKRLSQRMDGRSQQNWRENCGLLAS